MEDYPLTVAELEARFSTEEACRDYLFRLRWPNGFRCPRCSSEKFWSVGSTLYECVGCHIQQSVIAGTIFQGTRKPLATWFRAIWWLVTQKGGASALGLQRVLGLGSYETAWSWLHKLRRAMVRPGREKLSGIIEADEIYIGGKKPGKSGRGALGKSLVLVLVEMNDSKIGRIRLQRLSSASGNSITMAVQKFVVPGSIIKTDGLKSYLKLIKAGYQHEIIRKTEELGDNLLPRCHRVASLLKRWLLGTLQGAVSHEHLDYYLDEFTFRFNRRSSRNRGKLFYRLLQQAMEVEPAPYRKIIKHVRGLKPKYST